MISNEGVQQIPKGVGRGPLHTGSAPEQESKQEIQARKDEITAILKKVFEKKFSQHQHLTDQEKENLTSSFVNALSSDDQSESIDRFVSTYQEIYSSFSPIQLKYSIARRDLLTLFYQLRQYINKGTPIKRGEGDQMRVIALSELLTPAELLTPKPDGPLPNRTEHEERLELESSLSEFQTNSEKGAKSYEKYLDLVFSEHQTNKKAKKSKKETAPASNLDLLNLEDLQLFHHKLFYIDLYKKLLVKLEQYRNTRFPSIRQLIDQKSEQINAELRRYKNELIGLTIFPALRVLLGLFYPETKKMDVEELLPKFYLMLDQMNSLEGFKKVQDHIRIAINTNKLLGGSEEVAVVNGVFIDTVVGYIMVQVEEKSALEGFSEATVGRFGRLARLVKNRLIGDTTEEKSHEVYENLKSQMPFLITELEITYKALNLEGTGLADYESLHPLQQKKAMRMVLSHPKLNDILVNDWDGFVQRYEEFSAHTQGVNEEVTDLEEPLVEEVSDEEETQPEEPVVSELSQFLSSLNAEALLGAVNLGDLDEFVLPATKQNEEIVKRFAAVADLVKKQIAIEIFMDKNKIVPVGQWPLRRKPTPVQVPETGVPLDIHPITQKNEYNQVVELAYEAIINDIATLKSLFESLKNAAVAINTFLANRPINRNTKIPEGMLTAYIDAKTVADAKIADVITRYGFPETLAQFFNIPQNLNNLSTPMLVSTAVTQASSSLYKTDELIKAINGKKEEAKQVLPREVESALSLERIAAKLEASLEGFDENGSYEEFMTNQSLQTLLGRDENNTVMGNQDVIKIVTEFDAYLKKPKVREQLSDINLQQDIFVIIEKILSLPNKSVSDLLLGIFNGSQDTTEKTNTVAINVYAALVDDIMSKFRFGTQKVAFKDWFNAEYLFAKGDYSSKARQLVVALETIKSQIQGETGGHKRPEVLGRVKQNDIDKASLISLLQDSLALYGIGPDKVSNWVITEYKMPQLRKVDKDKTTRYGFDLGSEFVYLHSLEGPATLIYRRLEKAFNTIKTLDNENKRFDELLKIIDVVQLIREKGKGVKKAPNTTKDQADTGKLSDEQRERLQANFIYINGVMNPKPPVDTQKKKGATQSKSSVTQGNTSYYEFYTPEKRKLLAKLLAFDANLRAVIEPSLEKVFDQFEKSDIDETEQILKKAVVNFWSNRSSKEAVIDNLVRQILDVLFLSNQKLAIEDKKSRQAKEQLEAAEKALRDLKNQQ